MKPAKLNLQINQAASFDQPLQWLSDDVPVILTGYTFRMAAKAKVTDQTPAFLLTSENGGVVVTNAAQGRIAIHVSPQQSAALTQRNYVYDLLAIAPGGEDAYRLLEGSIVVEPAVTL